MALAKLIEKQGRTQEARYLESKALSRSRPAVTRRPGDADANRELGHTLFSQGKWDQAIATLREVLRINPEDFESRLNLGVALGMQGKLAEASVELREVTRHVPLHARAHNNLGYVLRRQGQLDEAVAEFREAVRINPYVQAVTNLVEALREVVRLKPDDFEAHNNLGLALKAQGRLDRAIAEHREAIQIKPDHALSHAGLADALLRQGKTGEAIIELREAIRLKPDFAEAHGSLGNSLKVRGKHDEAVAEYREAVRLKPEDAIIHYSLGIVLQAQEKLDEAAVSYREAVRLDTVRGRVGDAIDSLVDALKALGRLDGAVAEYREAVRLKPDDVATMAYLVAMLAERKGWGEIVTLTLRAVERKPDDPSLRHRLALAQLLSGDREGYRRACTSTVEKFGRSEAKFIGEAARACLIAPDPGVDLAAPRRLAEFAANREPKAPWWQYVQGLAFYRAGDFERAIACLNESGKVDPGWDATSLNWPVLAMAHHRLGHGAEARDWLAKARDARGDRSRGIPAATSRSPWHDREEFSILLRESEELIDGKTTDPAVRLPAVLRGEVPAGDAAEVAGLAYAADDRAMYATSARFFAEAFAADPKIAEVPRAGNRYNAARAAARAAAGQGKDEPPPDDAARSKLRRQALGWLKAELERGKKLLESGPPQSRPLIVSTLKHWRQDAGLATIRDAGALAKFPEAERKEWQAFWTDVEAVTAKS